MAERIAVYSKSLYVFCSPVFPPLYLTTYISLPTISGIPVIRALNTIGNEVPEGIEIDTARNSHTTTCGGLNDCPAQLACLRSILPVFTVRDDVDDEALTVVVVELERLTWMRFGEGRVQIRKDDCDSERVVERWTGIQAEDGLVGRCEEGN